MYCYFVKGKLKLTPENEEKILKNVEASRLAWNIFLEVNNERENSVPRKVKLDRFKLYKHLKTCKEDYPILKEADSQCLQEVTKDIIYQSIRFRKDPDNHEKPYFRDESNSKPSYITINNNNSIRLDGENKIRLPKIGWIEIDLDENIIGKIKKVRVIHTSPGTCDVEILILNDYEVENGYDAIKWGGDLY